MGMPAAAVLAAFLLPALCSAEGETPPETPPQERTASAAGSAWLEHLGRNPHLKLDPAAYAAEKARFYENFGRPAVAANPDGEPSPGDAPAAGAAPGSARGPAALPEGDLGVPPPYD